MRQEVTSSIYINRIGNHEHKGGFHGNQREEAAVGLPVEAVRHEESSDRTIKKKKKKRSDGACEPRGRS